MQLSGVLKRIAVKLSKTCNDLRLLSSGPRSGFGEINLPPMQAGSSIMPGKVNPVIPEVMNQVCFEVFGNDLTVTFAAEAGQLQLNAFEPIIASALFRSFKHLTNGCITLADRCVKGITANPERLRESIERSIALVTALNPIIGYKAGHRGRGRGLCQRHQRARGGAAAQADDRGRAGRRAAPRGADAAARVREGAEARLTPSDPAI